MTVSSSGTAEKTPCSVDVANVVPPSSICDQRVLSAAVVTDPNSSHKLAEGRPKVVLETPPEHLFVPPPLRATAWSQGEATEFNVRGVGYDKTDKTARGKVPSAPSVFRLLTVDLVQVDAPLFTGLCSHPQERIQMALKREKETGIQELPAFIYAVNLAIPGKSNYHFVAYFGIDDVSVLRNQETPLGRAAEPFFFGDSDQYRNETFKLIPRIAEGNVIVRRTVGSKPSILGSKLKQYYIRNERFFEMVVDISSSKVAQKIVKLALGYAKSLVVDMMFLVEGTDSRMLPEQILAGVRVSHLDFKDKDGQRRCTPL